MSYLYDLNKDKKNIMDPEQGIKDIVLQAYHQYKNRPRFFSPYTNRTELTQSLLAPFSYPIQLSYMSAVFLLSAGAAVLGALVKLVLGLVSWACKNENARKRNFDEVVKSLSVTRNYLAASLVCPLLALLSIPFSIISIITRSGASIAKVTTGYDDNYKEPRDSEDLPDPVSENQDKPFIL